MPDSWEQNYPRLYDLFVNSEKGNSANYFAGFPNQIRSELAREVYSELEKRLSLLSVSAWAALRCKALQVVAKKGAKRAWTQLFDVLNEAYGYELLLNAGYEKESIIFIQSSEKEKTPDLEGTKTDEVALVEVKTVNISDKELERRHESPPKARRAYHTMPKTLIAKIKGKVEEATKQLKSYCCIADNRKIVLVLLSLDSDTRRGIQLDSQIDDIASQYPEHEVVIKIIAGMD